MPGGDRTGPMGMGPMTGRGAGYCAGSPAPGFLNRGFGGGGFGRGRGGGQGWRNWFHSTGLTGWQRAAMAGPWGGAFARPVAPDAAETQELDTLRTQAEGLAGALEEVKNQIDQLEKQSQSASGKQQQSHLAPGEYTRGKRFSTFTTARRVFTAG